jgi:hypothetical protein
VEAIAERVVARLDERGLVPGADREAERGEDRWMDCATAARYLGTTAGALRKQVAAGAVPAHQDGPGCKLWFLRSELDAGRRGA